MNLEWKTENGVHYICYPFLIYKDEYSKNYKLTHMSCGALICSTDYLHSAKYIATRLLPLPQWLLPTQDLVKHMTEEQKTFISELSVSKLNPFFTFSLRIRRWEKKIGRNNGSGGGR